LRASFFGAVVGWWRKEMEWCTTTTLMTASLGGVMQWSLGDRYASMDSHRKEAPSGIMVASMTRLVRDFASV
jgi:hypothetical protein